MRESSVRYLLERNGVVMHVSRITNSVYDTGTGAATTSRETWPVTGLFVTDTLRRRDTDLAPRAALRAFIAADELATVPRISDQLLFEDSLYVITRVETVRERSTAVAYLFDLAEV